MGGEQAIKKSLRHGKLCKGKTHTVELSLYTKTRSDETNTSYNPRPNGQMKNKNGVWTDSRCRLGEARQAVSKTDKVLCVETKSGNE